MNSKQFGYDLLERVFDKFSDRARVDMEPKFIGRHLTMTISPTKKKKVKSTVEKKKNN
jgi:translation initiation factor IF-3